MTYKGIDLTALIGLVIAIVTGLLAKAQGKIAEANAEKSAWVRLGHIGLAMAGELWESLTLAYQQDMVDGKPDRELYQKIIAEKIEKFTSRQELEKLAAAVKLPVPGLIAWIAEFIIDRLMAAHSPYNPAVSPKQYPVTSEGDAEIEAELERLRAQGG